MRKLFIKIQIFSSLLHKTYQSSCSRDATEKIAKKAAKGIGATEAVLITTTTSTGMGATSVSV